MRVLDNIFVWSYSLPAEIWYATLWNLPPDTRELVTPEEWSVLMPSWSISPTVHVRVPANL